MLTGDVEVPDTENANDYINDKRESKCVIIINHNKLKNLTRISTKW